MNPIRVGVIGVGAWGKNHVRVFSELEEATLAGIVDRDVERAKSYAQKFNTIHYPNVEELLLQEDIDAVTICTPTVTHADLALQAIDAGKHLLLEKPMTDTAQQAHRVIDAAKSANTILMVGFVERFNPSVETAAQIIDEEKIGELVLGSARRLGPFVPGRVADIGIIKDMAIHDIDIARFLAKQEASSVYAIAGQLYHKYEDYANLVIRFDDKPTFFLECNWLTPHKMRGLNITGSQGVISLDYISQEVTLGTSQREQKSTSQWDEPLKRELSHFVKCITENQNPTTSGSDGLEALRIAEAALKSAHTKSIIYLEEFRTN
ncbi:MAG: Gfo/Idh/MocA family oxidoreductase [Candidatus Hermodarchaeia archaeon]